MLEFTKNITILSPDISKDIKKIIKKCNLKYIKKTYKKTDIKKFKIVIVTAPSINLQKKIFQESKNYSKCLCNCVDSKKYSNIIFPAFIKKGDLTITISTNGTSPAFTKQFKRYLKNHIPKDINIFLKQMKLLRKELPKGNKRMKLFNKKVKYYLKNNIAESKLII